MYFDYLEPRNTPTIRRVKTILTAKHAEDADKRKSSGGPSRYPRKPKLGGEAPIDNEFAAGDESGVFRKEESDGADDVL